VLLLVAAPKLPFPSIRLGGRRVQYQESGNMVTLAKVSNNCTSGQIKVRHSGASNGFYPDLEPRLGFVKLVAIFLQVRLIRKPALQGPNIWAVAIRALGENPLVEDYRISAD
jgi:hypothetical protein